MNRKFGTFLIFGLSINKLSNIQISFLFHLDIANFGFQGLTSCIFSFQNIYSIDFGEALYSSVVIRINCHIF